MAMRCRRHDVSTDGVATQTQTRNRIMLLADTELRSRLMVASVEAGDVEPGIIGRWDKKLLACLGGQKVQREDRTITLYALVLPSSRGCTSWEPRGFVNWNCESRTQLRHYSMPKDAEVVYTL